MIDSGLEIKNGWCTLVEGWSQKSVGFVHFEKF